MEEIFDKSDVRERVLVSDNSDYFSKYGSGKIKLTITEEIDNIIGAEPDNASIDIKNIDYNGTCTIETFNDGVTPTTERMEKMNCIGKSSSDKRGPSLCGVGQIEGLIAGRKDTTYTGILTFESVHNGEYSRFTCSANGLDYSIKTTNEGPYPTSDKDRVVKRFEGMIQTNQEQLELVKAICAIKIYPYSKKNPNFKFKFNGEILEPINVMYDGVNDERVKRTEIKDYKIKYHGREYTVKYYLADYSRYIKPDGQIIDKNCANKFDILSDMSLDSGGVFVELGGSVVITGGKDSWGILDDKGLEHTTHNGQRVWISIPTEDNVLKEVIFAESANKSEVGVCLNKITNEDGTKVFSEMIRTIKKTITKWTKERTSIDAEGNQIEQYEKDRLYNEAVNNETFREYIIKAFEALSESQANIVAKKKVTSILSSVTKLKDAKNNFYEEKLAYCGT